MKYALVLLAIASMTFVTTVFADTSAATTPERGVGAGTVTRHGGITAAEIFARVNLERSKAGLPPLTTNIRLIVIAETKNKDMIDNQYFAHMSPQGVDLHKLVVRLGFAYDFLEVGENLALGDFTSSDDVMDSFMSSPDHQSNILDKNYSEIGISVLIGNYHGHPVWYVVQEFGRPRPNKP
jgi:uncharacterized protein YkwD